MDSLHRLTRRLRRMLQAEEAKIQTVGEKMFFLVGERRNTKDDIGFWCDGYGKRVPDWDYVAWRVVASGKTRKELIASATEYYRLINMTFEEIVEELFGPMPTQTYKVRHQTAGIISCDGARAMNHPRG